MYEPSSFACLTATLESSISLECMGRRPLYQISGL